jgi:hypothetical protein
MVRLGKMDPQYAMMVTMTTDATGRGTRDTGHTVPDLRAPTPDTSRTVGVPSAYALPEGITGHGTRDTRRDTVPSAAQDAPRPDPRDVPRDAQRDTPINGTRDTDPDGTPNGTSRWFVPRLVASYRDARDTRKQAERDTVAARQAARDVAAQDVSTARDALTREATRSRRRAGGGAATTDTDRIAPIPDGMVKAGIWMDRAAGFAVPTAPLLVSAWATIHVGQDEPLKMGWLAVAFTLGLEGSVWYLNRLREAFKLEGDSTFSFNVSIAGIITLIFGLIGGHAIWNSAGRQALLIHVPGVEAQVPLSEVMPAIAVAIMSAIGAYVWAKKATFRHRAKLRAMNQIDPRAPKFALGRWVSAPRETFFSLRHAFRYGITEAKVAVTDWRVWKATGKPAIWPVPPGFRYVDGKLTQMTIEELQQDAARDALVAEIIARDTDTAGQQDTRPAEHGTATGRATARPALTNGTPSGTPTGHSTALNGTSRTGQHGTRDADTPRDTDGTPNGTPPAVDHGTRDTGHGTRDTDGTPGADGADVLKYAEHLIAVTDAFPQWQTGALPAVRKITAAIDEYRRRNDGGSYNSNATSAAVQRALVKLREQPQLLDLIRVQQEEPTA